MTRGRGKEKEQQGGRGERGGKMELHAAPLRVMHMDDVPRDALLVTL